MRVDDAIKYFGSGSELARQLKLKSAASPTNWRRRYRGIVPEQYARRLRDMTGGKLKFDPKTYGLDS
jgi:hypothetical protein